MASLQPGRGNEERRSNTGNGLGAAASARASSLVDALLSTSQHATSKGFQTIMVWYHPLPIVIMRRRSMMH